LCCDGLSDLVDDWMIREIYDRGRSDSRSPPRTWSGPPTTTAGTDNITVVLTQAFFDTTWAMAQPAVRLPAGVLTAHGSRADRPPGER
jgi:serine/threonine protein phosphatase PrpC